MCSLWLVPTYGWRVLFVVGVAPAFLSVWARWKVPESPRWLATKGRLAEGTTVLTLLGASDDQVRDVQPDEVVETLRLRTLLQPPYLKRFILTAGYYFFSYFGYYGFVLWLPSILATIFHLSLVTTFTYTLYVALAAIVGRVFAFWTIDRFGRKQLFYVGFGIGGIAALLFGTIQDPTLLVACACLMSFLYEQGVAGTVVWTAELYPSHVRATAVSWSTGFGRIQFGTESRRIWMVRQPPDVLRGVHHDGRLFLDRRRARLLPGRRNEKEVAAGTSGRMKAVGYRRPLPVSGPDALLDLELPDPEPSGRDLLVDVRAVSVNPIDTKTRRRVEPAPGTARILGYDAAGIAVATGPNVTLFRPGDEVCYAGSIVRPGTNAERHLVDERIVGWKPRTLSFADAAAQREIFALYRAGKLSARVGTTFPLASVRDALGALHAGPVEGTMTLAIRPA